MRRDPTPQESFEALAELVTGELLGDAAIPGRLKTVAGARGIAERIAAAVLDRFVVRPLPGDRQTNRPACTDSGVILDIRDLSVAYGTNKAVDGVSFRVGRSEIFGLLGPNGAGKTSTLSAIEGLIAPHSGEVLLDGIDVRRHPARVKARLGVQLQATSFQSQLTIRQIVRLYAGLYGVPLTGREIAGALHEIGLGGEANKPFKQLSGGQQQRLALHIAVVHQPTLLLLDEPTVGLDPQSRRQLWGRIEDVRQHGGSILLTTHSMEEAEALCDRVAIIDHGRLLTCATPRNLVETHKNDPEVCRHAHGPVTLEDVFVGLTGTQIRD